MQILAQKNENFYAESRKTRTKRQIIFACKRRKGRNRMPDKIGRNGHKHKAG